MGRSWDGLRGVMQSARPRRGLACLAVHHPAIFNLCVAFPSTAHLPHFAQSVGHQYVIPHLLGFDEVLNGAVDVQEAYSGTGGYGVGPERPGAPF